MGAPAYRHIRGLQPGQIALDWDRSTKTVVEHVSRTCSGDFYFGVKDACSCR